MGPETESLWAHLQFGRRGRAEPGIPSRSWCNEPTMAGGLHGGAEPVQQAVNPLKMGSPQWQKPPVTKGLAPKLAGVHSTITP